MAVSKPHITLDEYLARPESRYEEYADGELVATPPPSVLHQYAAAALRAVLAAACGPDHLALEAVGWQLGQDGPYRIPDVAVVPRSTVALPYAIEAPLLVGEVLSPGEQMGRKLAEYGRAGLGHHLTFDPGSGLLVYYQNRGSRLVETARALPDTRIELTEPFPVVIDPAQLLP